MKAVILAGGLGTRLRPLTCAVPKPLVPVVNKPLLEYTLQLLKKHGFDDILILLYYRGDSIRDFAGDGGRFGIRISYLENEEDLGTAGSVESARSCLEQPFLVISGDTISNFNLEKLADFHRDKKSLLTIVLTRVKDPLEFGITVNSKDGRIERFLEKPSPEKAFSKVVNTGMYIIDPEVMDYIPHGQKFDFSKDLFPVLLEKELPLYGYTASGYWKDVGTINEYLNVHNEILKGNADFALSVSCSGTTVRKKVCSGEKTTICRDAVFEGKVVIGSNCVIGSSARLRDTVIGNNCIVEESASVSRSVIWDNVVIGKKAVLKEMVAGMHCRIGREASIQEKVVIGDGCSIGDFSILKKSVKISPGINIEARSEVSNDLP